LKPRPTSAEIHQMAKREGVTPSTIRRRLRKAGYVILHDTKYGFPELTKHSAGILRRVADGESVETVARNFPAPISTIRARLWSAVNHVWITRDFPCPRPRSQHEIPLAILILEAPELARKRERLLNALPIPLEPKVITGYLKRGQ
jgi:antitoxin (DNA-binding transcriptional repressor) of toxin-antitoxin stability system